MCAADPTGRVLFEPSWVRPGDSCSALAVRNPKDLHRMAMTSNGATMTARHHRPVSAARRTKPSPMPNRERTPVSGSADRASPHEGPASVPHAFALDELTDELAVAVITAPAATMMLPPTRPHLRRTSAGTAYARSSAGEASAVTIWVSPMTRGQGSMLGVLAIRRHRSCLRESVTAFATSTLRLQPAGELGDGSREQRHSGTPRRRSHGDPALDSLPGRWRETSRRR